MQLSPQSTFRTHLSSQTFLQIHLQSTPTPTSNPSPTEIYFSSSLVFLVLSFLEISYKWNNSICSLMYLALFIQHVFEVHPWHYMYQLFIFLKKLLSSTPTLSFLRYFLILLQHNLLNSFSIFSWSSSEINHFSM